MGLEREFTIPARQPLMDQHVTLTALPERPAPPPPAPAPAPAPKPPGLPPPGRAMSLSVPDFIEKNFITNNQPQKSTPVGCSGLLQSVVWQVREPWENRKHEGADVTVYVIGGEGTLALDGQNMSLQAGSFALVPRGSSYSLTRRGRNPLIVLATMAGEPCP
jgi:mannose-6-phosphate isomerase-like protein (cupin superfamily)